MTKVKKTKVESNIILNDVPKMILTKYRGKSINNQLRSILSNQKMIAYPKEICNVCEIDKELTFHLARHTFAIAIKLEEIEKMFSI